MIHSLVLVHGVVLQKTHIWNIYALKMDVPVFLHRNEFR